MAWSTWDGLRGPAPEGNFPEAAFNPVRPPRGRSACRRGLLGPSARRPPRSAQDRSPLRIYSAGPPRVRPPFGDERGAARAPGAVTRGLGPARTPVRRRGAGAGRALFVGAPGPLPGRPPAASSAGEGAPRPRRGQDTWRSGRRGSARPRSLALCSPPPPSRPPRPPHPAPARPGSPARAPPRPAGPAAL